MNDYIKPADYWVDWKVAAGTKIADDLTLESILRNDEEPLPLLLRHPGDVDSAPRVIPYDRYLDPKYVDLEIDHIWNKQWQIACRAEDIPQIGDRINYDIVDRSFIVIRSGENEFKAFFNSCRHRGRKLCEAKGNGKSIRCPFHAWEYGLDGKLLWIPFEQDFPHIDPEHFGLMPIQAAEWGGNVFVNPDLNAPPLTEALGPLVSHYAEFPIGERYTALRIVVEVGCNWKAAQEAFMEGLHVVQTHADGMPMFGAMGTQIDLWSDGLGFVSRLITPGATTDSWLNGQVTAHECATLYCTAYNLPLPPDDRANDPVDARKYCAEEQRKRIEAQTGKDWSDKTTGYFIDMAKYFMFPNHHPWWGEGLPWWYNFKPLGRNPDTSLMEVRVLQPIPASGERPPVPDTYYVNLGEKAEEKFPELGSTAHLLDQDLINMYAVQLGFKAAAPGAAFLTLSNYHEAKIRHFHEIYDRLLGLETAD